MGHPNSMSHYLNDPDAGPLLVQISSIYSTERHSESATNSSSEGDTESASTSASAGTMLWTLFQFVTRKLQNMRITINNFTLLTSKLIVIWNQTKGAIWTYFSTFLPLQLLHMDSVGFSTVEIWVRQRRCFSRTGAISYISLLSFDLIWFDLIVCSVWISLSSFLPSCQTAASNFTVRDASSPHKLFG